MMHKQTGKHIAVKHIRISGVPEENKRIFMDLNVVLKCHDCDKIVRGPKKNTSSCDPNQCKNYGMCLLQSNNKDFIRFCRRSYKGILFREIEY
jgi:hypothetical protein